MLNQAAIVRNWKDIAMVAYIGKPPASDAEIVIDPVSQVATLHFSLAAANRLRQALIGVDHPVDGTDNAYVSHLRQIGFDTLPAAAIAAFDAIRSGAFAPTALITTGLPFDPVSAAPLRGEAPRDRKPTDLSENLTTLFGAMIGEPYGLAGEGARLVNDLIPTEEDRARLTGNGSERPLDLHTENAAHRRLFQDRDLSPLGLVLTGVCAQSEAGPKTWVANGRLAAARLPKADYDQLRRPAYAIALPLRQRRADAEQRVARGPILSGERGREFVTAAFYGDMLRPSSRAAAKAADAFKCALEEVAVGIAIAPSFCVYVPNAYALHARDGFVPQFDAQGRAHRWLQRVFVTGRLDGFDRCGAVSERVFTLADKSQGR